MLIKRLETNKMLSLSIAILLNATAINQIIIAMFPSLSGGLLTPLYFFSIAIYFISYIFGKHNTISVNLFRALYLLVFFYSILVLLLFDVKSSSSISKLVVFTIVPLFLLDYRGIDYRKALEYSIIITAVGVFLLPKIFSKTYSNISMGMSYAFLFPIIAAITYLRYCNNKTKILTIASIMNLLYVIEIFLYGSRGVVLCILGAIASVFLISKREKEGIAIRKKWLFLWIVIFLFFVAFFENIVYWIYYILNNNNISSGMMSKVISLLESNNFQNGRQEIYSEALRGIWQSPIFGHGISSFYANTGYVYPHNFILQLLYDTGLIGTLIFILGFVSGFIRWINYCDDDTFLIGFVVINSSFIGALFSGDMWLNLLLIFMISFFTSYSYNTNKQNLGV